MKGHPPPEEGAEQFKNPSDPLLKILYTILNLLYTIYVSRSNFENHSYNKEIII